MTAGAIAVRPAVPEDAEQILAFIRELAEYERMADEVVADAALLRAQLFGPKPGAEVLIGEWNGAACGFALYFQNFSTFLGRRGIHLEDLFVRPAARGLGLGRALLSAVAAEAVARQCGRMEWSVLDWNEAAIGFYRALGARPLEGWSTFRLTGADLQAVGKLPKAG